MAFSEYEYKYQVRDFDIQIALYEDLTKRLEDHRYPLNILIKYERAIKQLEQLIDRRKRDNKDRLEEELRGLEN